MKVMVHQNLGTGGSPQTLLHNPRPVKGVDIQTENQITAGYPPRRVFRSVGSHDESLLVKEKTQVLRTPVRHHDHHLRTGPVHQVTSQSDGTANRISVRMGMNNDAHLSGTPDIRIQTRKLRCVKSQHILLIYTANLARILQMINQFPNFVRL